jgi:hypothetical protein
MLNKIKNILSKPYDLFESKSLRIYFIFIPALFVSLFIFMFRPFGFIFTPLSYVLKLCLLYGLLTALVMFLNLFVLQKYIFKHFTIGRTIIWNTWLLISIGIVNAFVVLLVFNGGDFVLSYFFQMQGYTLSLGTIISLFMIMIHYNFQLKQRLKKVNTNASGTRNCLIEFMPENNKSPLQVPRKELYYIKSADNYIDVYFTENKALKHKLIRLTLKSTVQMLTDFPEFKKCHKSFIVNLEKAKCLTSSANGYKLFLHDFEEQIPVSRQLKDEIAHCVNKKEKEAYNSY